MSPRSTSTEQAADRDEATTTEQGFVEYLGYKPYGTEFDDARVISRKDAKAAWDVSIPKDLRWDKETRGKNRGRMLLPLADVPEEVRDLLLEDEAFKVVTE